MHEFVETNEKNNTDFVSHYIGVLNQINCNELLPTNKFGK